MPDIISQLNQINSSLEQIAHHTQPFWDTQLFGVLIGGLLGLLPWLYTVWKDRAIIKVKAQPAMYFSPSGLPQKAFSIQIINFGRRPVTINDVHLLFKDGGTLIFPTPSLFVEGASGLPKILNESSSHSVTLFAASVSQEFFKKQEYPIAACYRSATGKIYKTKTNKKFWDIVFTNGEKK